MVSEPQVPVVPSEAPQARRSSPEGSRGKSVGATPPTREGPQSRPPFPSSNHPGLEPQLLEKYVTELEIGHPVKTALQSRAPECPFVINLDDFVSGSASMAFKESLSKVLARGLKNYKSRGPVVSSYWPMGVSPRIAPYQYGCSFNAIKKVLRSKLLAWSAKDLETSFEPYTFLDIDLVSCYTSILLGLYPTRLPSVLRAVNQGLWGFIEGEFKAQGVHDSFHKPSVKIAVHSSLFRGGNNAMITGILEGHRKDVGMAPKEWRECSEREVVKARAIKLVSILQTSSIILEQRALSTFLESKWINTIVEGPSGHKYGVTAETFGSNYASYLQSYEICLLAQALLKTKATHPEVVILGHFHDGALLVFPRTLPKEVVVSSLEKALEETRVGLGLAYPQRFSFSEIGE